MKLLVAIGGHTGTGKTTLAYQLKKRCPVLQKALILDDDAVRRQLLKVGLAETLSDEAYSDALSKQVVEEIEKQTVRAFLSGTPVINSSGFFSEWTQKSIEKMAERAKAQFIGLWLAASVDEMKTRIRKRKDEREKIKELSLEKGHASDADEGVIRKFGSISCPSSRWHQLDAEVSEKEILSVAVDIVSNDLK